MSNCGCCCTNTLNFCDQNVCGEIDFDILAQIAGTHKLITKFLGISLVIQASFGVGESLIFPLDKLNENFEYTVELFDPNGDKIVIRKSNIDYDCFKFNTVISKTLVSVINESS